MSGYFGLFFENPSLIIMYVDFSSFFVLIFISPFLYIIMSG